MEWKVKVLLGSRSLPVFRKDYATKFYFPRFFRFQKWENEVKQKTNSREPSYRYITVRESIDAIRQRLNEQQQTNAACSCQTAPAGTRPIREHYYSSIGGGSDYETLNSEAASGNACITVDEEGAPRPPTSPIPVRTNVEEDGNSISPSFSGCARTANFGSSYSTTTEKIRQLRSNFFDPELKLPKELEHAPSSGRHFEPPKKALNKQLTFGTNDWKTNPASSSFCTIHRSVEGTSSTRTRNLTFRSASFSSDFPAFRQKLRNHFGHRSAPGDSRSRSFHGSNIFASKRLSSEELMGRNDVVLAVCEMDDGHSSGLTMCQNENQ
ncbi:unnamed protein product, partial [Gongylonema pulchrum]|uniref:Uncharacterized protein n=1 Tax=Gongylonema pulchrum TaxID=637853 RepID=A0A183D0Z5_9BILA